MHNVSEDVAFTANVPVPDDGVDFRTAASLEGAFSALADRTRWLRGVLAGNVSLSIIFQGAFRAVSNALFNGTVTVEGTSTFQDTIDAQLINATLVEGSIGVGGDAITAHNTLQCTGNSYLYGDTQIGTTAADASVVWATCTHRGPVTCASTCTLNGALALNAVSSIGDVMSFTGVGRTRRASRIGVQSGGEALTATLANHYYYPVVTADQNCQLTGGQDGDWITIDNDSNTHTVTVLNTASSGGAIMAVLKTATSFPSTVTVRRIAGLWVAMPTWINQ